MTRNLWAACLSIAFCCVPAGAQQMTSGPTRLQRILTLARDAGLPLGIVIDRDHTLCHVSETTSSNAPFELTDPRAAAASIQTLARASGYRAEQTGGVLLLRPSVHDRTTRALHYRFPSFPAQTGTMWEAGATLAGWTNSYRHLGQGYGISSSSGPQAQVVTLPASRGLTVEAIASRIVLLGDKGVWLAGESPGGRFQLAAYSYKDDRVQIEAQNCQQF